MLLAALIFPCQQKVITGGEMYYILIEKRRKHFFFFSFKIISSQLCTKMAIIFQAQVFFLIQHKVYK